MGLCVGLGNRIGLDSMVGEVIIPDTGRPLEDHPYWRLHSGVTSQMGWEDGGDKIKFFTSANAVVSNVQYKGFAAIEGVFTANYQAPTVGSNWLLPFAKFINTANILGVRMVNGSIEIIQRKNNTWTTLASGGVVPAGSFEVIVNITTTHISVLINGVLQLEADHTTSTAGGFGISGHRWDEPDALYLTNFDVNTLAHHLITHDGAQVTYDTENVYSL